MTSVVSQMPKLVIALLLSFALDVTAAASAIMELTGDMPKILFGELP